MHSGLVHVGDWVEVTLWDDEDYWQVVGMTHYGRFQADIHSAERIAQRRKITYSLPIRGVLEDGAEILVPDSGAFLVQGKPINSFIEEHEGFHIGFLYLNYKNVIRVEPSKPCSDCGWFCFQQCFQLRESYRPEDILQ